MEEEEDTFLADLEEPKHFADLVAAANDGDTEAKVVLAWLKLQGRGSAKMDKEGGYQLLEECVALEDSDAMWLLGICNEYGLGCKQNIERAKDLYAKSCSNGNPLGTLLAKDRKDSVGSIDVVMKGLLKALSIWYVNIKFDEILVIF